MKTSILRQLIAFPALLALLAALHAYGRASSASDAPVPAPTVNADLVLSVGQSLSLSPGATLRLDRVNDSRCKTGAVCVWAGYISFSFTLSDAKGDVSFVLAKDMPNGSSTALQHGLNFTLGELDPAAPPALHATQPDYKVSLHVANQSTPPQ